MKSNIFLLLLSFYLVSNFTLSQNHVFKEFGVNDGLPSSQVYDLYQDKKGNIWFATDRGLAHFNGYEFKKYGVEDGLPGNVILSFFPQNNGEVWCSTINKEIFYFNENFKEFHTFKFNNLIKNKIKIFLI